MAIPSAIVTAYYGNNFDINNIPASPAVLASASQTVEVGVINCLPFSGKSRASITIKAFDKLKETSYFKIHFGLDDFDWYAALLGYDYVSMDTVTLDLAIDAWLTCGGVDGITSVSGLTKRHSCADDTYGKYTQPDPLVNPSEALKLSEITKLFTGEGYDSEDGYVIVESTVDLWEMGYDATSPTFLALTYENPNDLSSVTVPQVTPVDKDDEAMIFSYNGIGIPKKIESPCVGYYDGSSLLTRNAIAACRSLGVENGILAQYIVPKEYIEQITLDPVQLNRISSMSGRFEVIGNYVNDDLKYEYAKVNNKRVLYGSNNRYVLNSIGSGNKLESSPEEVYNNNTEQPEVYVMTDPRSKGMPYFRFTKMYNNYADVEVNAVKGLEWQSAPLLYSEKSGATYNREIFEASQEISKAEYEVGKLSKYVGTVAGGASSIAENAKNAEGVRGGMFTLGLTMAAQTFMDSVANDPIFYGRRELEKVQFEVGNSIVAPELTFPRSEGLRDIVGNGVYLYRYMYTPNDVARIDKILNMYGYVDVKPLELTDFTNMKYYSYVEADATIVTSVKVTKAIRELCHQQISAGVRVWKQNPDFSLYDVSNREV